jgi:hypothetical protein
MRPYFFVRSFISTAAGLAVALALAIAPLVTGAKSPVRVSGTAISMEPPAGFTASSRFSGFEHGEVPASIMITEIPGPFSEVGKILVPEQLAKQRMSLIEKSDVTVNGAKAILAYATQRYAAEDFLKWMLLVGDESKTRMIVATFPKEDEALFKEAMKTSLLSATWSNAPVDPYDGLNYKIEAAGSLKLAGRVSNMLMFTESGQTRIAGVDEALFVFGNSIADRDLSNLKAFAEARIMQTARMTDVKITSSTPMRVAGLNAQEVIASAKDAGSETPMLIYLTLVADGKTYYIAQGMVSAKRADAVLPNFRKTTASFKKN